jgi:hypothetical protein
MQLSHIRPVVSASFDEPNLVSAAGLVPLMALAREAGLRELADERLSVPTDKGAHAGLKVSSLVAGMAAGADSIDDMALLRHGGMGKVFTGAYAPSTLGSFLRTFTFGHVRQLDAVASRFLGNLAERTLLLGGPTDAGPVLLDLDDTIVEVHGYAKQGAAFGYSGVRGLSALLATVSTQTVAPVIAAQRLRKGSAGSARLATDTPALISRSQLAGRDVLLRADSAFSSPTTGDQQRKCRADRRSRRAQVPPRPHRRTSPAPDQPVGGSRFRGSPSRGQCGAARRGTWDGRWRSTCVCAHGCCYPGARPPRTR